MSEEKSLEEKITEFRNDRDSALLTMDEQKIREFGKRYNIQMSEKPLVFWATVHKSITAVQNLPLELRQKSKDWLTENGFQSMDPGDLK